MNPRSNWKILEAVSSTEVLAVGPHCVMRSWEKPLIETMVAMVHKLSPGKRFLEVGFGMGISASFLQHLGVDTHRIIEPHPEIAKAALSWAGKRSRISIIADFWQNVLEESPPVDGIIFDSYCDSVEGTVRETIDFLERCTKGPLVKGGALTFFNAESVLSHKLQTVIYKHYSEIHVCPVIVERPKGFRMIGLHDSDKLLAVTLRLD
jgi:guanidinoacetate N-methyltransferase